MDFDQYVAARRSRLIDDAISNGVPVDEADELVDSVLDSHRREITRADDPHPLLQDAVVRAARGEDTTQEGRSPLLLLPVAALALIVVVVLAVTLLGRGTGSDDKTTPTPSPTTAPLPSETPSDLEKVGRRMPLLLGYDGATAVTRLRQLGLVPVGEPVPSCAPLGLVLGSSPVSGTPLRAGDQVVVQTSAVLRKSSTCTEVQRDDLAEAWGFVRYLINRATAPRFADKVTLVIDGSGAITLSGAEAGRNGFAGFAQYFQQFSGINGVSADGRYPELTALEQVPAPIHCGVARPAELGARTALSVSLESYTLGDDDDCAPTLDLYSTGGLIDGVVLYRQPSGSTPSGQPIPEGAE